MDHPPTKWVRLNVKLGLEIMNTRGRKTFDEDIGDLIQSRNKSNIKLLVGHLLTDKMVVNLNAFSPSIENRMRNSTSIVTPNH